VCSDNANGFSRARVPQVQRFVVRTRCDQIIGRWIECYARDITRVPDKRADYSTLPNNQSNEKNDISCNWQNQK
jgi:hypothetical protein